MLPHFHRHNKHLNRLKFILFEKNQSEMNNDLFLIVHVKFVSKRSELAIFIPKGQIIWIYLTRLDHF